MFKGRVIVSGAGGFLGSVLVRQLYEKTDGHIYALSSQKKPAVNELWENRVTYLDKSALERGEIELGAEDVFINCAFPRNADGTQMADGLDYIKKTLESAVRGGIGAVINISSQSVYSQTRAEAATEDTALNLESTYAVGKYATELLTNSICRGIPHTNIRLASLIGVNFDQRLINKMVKFAAKGNDLRVVAGDQKFGFLDVRDAADAIVRMVCSEKRDWHEAYNLGPQHAYTLREMAQLVAELAEEMCGITVKINEEPGEGRQNSDLDCSLFYVDFGWKPTFSIRDTAREIFGAEIYN